MWSKESLSYWIGLASLCLFLLVGCNAKQDYADNSQVGNEVRGQIKRYYQSLFEANEHPLSFNRAITTLDRGELSEVSISALGQYLFSKGYRVEAKGEPLFIEFQEPYAIYSIDVETYYPKDSVMNGELLHEPENIWINVESRLNSKIESKDFFISARTYKYEFLNH